MNATPDHANRPSAAPSPVPAPGQGPGPVTAGDVDAAVLMCLDLLGGAPADRWDEPAGPVAWSCWETAEHLADDLFAYALQLGPRVPSLTTHVPTAWRRRTPQGPANTISVERQEGPEGLLNVLEACGALLVSMVRTTPPDRRSHHVHGASDPEGFGAMGVVETLAHSHDLAAGLGLAFEPPAGLCARALHRLFPEAPRDAEPWPALLWCTGRAELPGHPRRTSWRWNGRPRV